MNATCRQSSSTRWGSWIARDKEPDLRVRAAFVLKESGDRRALEPLLEALQGTAAGDRLAAVQALAAFPDPRTSAAVVEALAHDDAPVVRAMAAQTLRILGDRGTIPAVEATLADRDPAVQDGARRAPGISGEDDAR